MREHELNLPKIIILSLAFIFAGVLDSSAQNKPQPSSKSQPAQTQPAPAIGPSERLEPIGYGSGGRYTAFAFDQASPEVVLIGSDVAGFFKSTNGGEDFKLKGNALGNLSIASLASNPKVAHELFVLGWDGLYQSPDMGDKLKLISSKVAYSNRFFGSKLILFEEDGIYVATDKNGVFKITKAGDGYKEERLPGLDVLKINAIARTQFGLMAATSRGAYLWVDGRWKLFSDGLPGDSRDCQDLAADPSGAVFICEKRNGVFTFDSGKQRWVRPGATPTPSGTNLRNVSYKMLVMDPKEPKRLFLAVHPEFWPRGLFKSEDAGASWTQINDFKMGGGPENWTTSLEATEALGFAPDGKLYLADWWNVWRSDNNGDTWTQIHKGLQNVVVTDIKTSPSDTSYIYMGTSDNGLMISKDGGSSWRRSMNGVKEGDVQEVQISSNNPDLVYILSLPWEVENLKDAYPIYLYRSKDKGENFELLRFDIPKTTMTKDYQDGKPYCLKLHPQDDNILYVGTNGRGIFKVDVTKASAKIPPVFQNISQNLAFPNLRGKDSLAIHHSDSNVIFAATQGGGLYKTNDGGNNWKQVTPGVTFCFGVIFNPTNSKTIYATLPEKKVIISEDTGQTFKTISLPGDKAAHVYASSLAIAPDNSQHLFVGTAAYDLKAADGVFESKDNGKTFNHISSELPRANVTALYAPKGKSLLIGFNGLGIFKLK